jgi:hypothetical protein
MNSIVLAPIAADIIRHRMDEATSGRRAREVQPASARTPRLQALRRHLARRAPSGASAPIGTPAHR